MGTGLVAFQSHPGGRKHCLAPELACSSLKPQGKGFTFPGFCHVLSLGLLSTDWMGLIHLADSFRPPYGLKDPDPDHGLEYGFRCLTHWA